MKIVTKRHVEYDANAEADENKREGMGQSECSSYDIGKQNRMPTLRKHGPVFVRGCRVSENSGSQLSSLSNYTRDNDLFYL